DSAASVEWNGDKAASDIAINTVHLDKALDYPLKVMMLTDADAQLGTDFTLDTPDSSVTIPAGALSADFVVHPRKDGFGSPITQTRVMIGPSSSYEIWNTHSETTDFIYDGFNTFKEWPRITMIATQPDMYNDGSQNAQVILYRDGDTSYQIDLNAL